MATTRRVWAELSVNTPKATQRFDFDLEGVWYGPDGAEVARVTSYTFVQADWMNSQHNQNWGCDSAPCGFRPGTYRVTIKYQGRLLKEAT